MIPTDITTNSFTRADPVIRAGAFLIECIIWTFIWWGVSSQLSFPTYVELISTWPAFVIYKTTMLWRIGAHIGHLALGIRIVDYETGGHLSFKQAFIRTLPEVSYEFFVTAIINLLMIFNRADHRHCFDLFAGTIATISDNPETSNLSYHDETPDTKPTAPADTTIYRKSEPPPF